MRLTKYRQLLARANLLPGTNRQLPVRLENVRQIHLLPRRSSKGFHTSRPKVASAVSAHRPEWESASRHVPSFPVLHLRIGRRSDRIVSGRRKWKNTPIASRPRQRPRIGALYFLGSRRNGVLRDQVRQHPHPLPGPTQDGYEPMNCALKTRAPPRRRLSHPDQIVAHFAQSDQARFE